MRLSVSTFLPLIAILAATPAAATETWQYQNNGTPNPTAYTLVASTTGMVSAYFMGSTAAFDESLGLLVNGATVASGVLGNHSTPNFTRYDFGSFEAGTTLTFFIDVANTGKTYFSDASLNADGVNHVYAANHPDQWYIGVPEGLFIGFEDLDGGGDFNYNDHTFVMSNVSIGTLPLPGDSEAGAPAVPEPATWAMMIAGFGLVGSALRRQKARIAFAV